ncbi:MAG: FecR domain-containing protein, partial [Terrimonas sp.]|nr:FecR domain-containing protein [Terrimonas sp.]
MSSFIEALSMYTPEFRKQLVERYKNNLATDKEVEVFLQLLEQGVLDEEFNSQFDWIEENIENELHEEPSPKRSESVYIRKFIFSAAALLLLVFSAVIYFVYTKSSAKPETPVIVNNGRLGNDVQPGGNKATLTLGNGTVIVLDSMKNGLLADQEAATILKVADGQLAYDAVDNTTGVMQYNILTTPNGGQYKINLPDGSRVFLNASSSIRFPVSFRGNVRKVEITGEAWFEVAKNASMPFIVVVDKKTEIEVLGTQFNVNAYANENAVVTTLVEGSIKIMQGSAEKKLQPGQQAVVDKEGDIRLVSDVDTESATAWVNGMFVFDNTPVESIMRQVERWYNVTTIYKGQIEPGFTARISR